MPKYIPQHLIIEHTPLFCHSIYLLNTPSYINTINNLQWFLVSAFWPGHHQAMHHFKLKENHTITLMYNGKRSHSLYIDIDKTIKTLLSG